MSRFFATRWGPVVTGAVLGILAVVLVQLGNPGNMGICVACFSRDIAGALGLHHTEVAQYLRPEIPGLLLGAFFAAILFGELRPRTGSAPLARFLLGALSMIGALVFLGCPWRAYLRLGGGDGNALPGIAGLVSGIAGLVSGIAIGVVFLRHGFSLGRNHSAPRALGWVMPLLAVVLLVLLVLAPHFGRDATGNVTGPIFASVKGPGSQHAPWLISLGAGLLIGFLAQRSRFCTVGAVRDLILLRDPHLAYGLLALVAAAFLTNLALGQLKPGFLDQPLAHTNVLWNFAGMVLSGLAFTLAGGCPGRQVFLAGEGDGDAAVFVLGMGVGAALGHLLNTASSPAGPGLYGPAAVTAGLIVCVIIGMTMREPRDG
jgi:YedE family putative selenium metabolism protein